MAVPPTSRPRAPRPSLRVAISLLVLGVVAAIVAGVGLANGLIHTLDNATLVSGPGTVQVQCRTGTYLLYVENGSPAVSGLPSSVVVTGPGGAAVPLQAQAATETVTRFGQRFSGQLGFSVDTAGSYTVAVHTAGASLVVAPSFTTIAERISGGTSSCWQGFSSGSPASSSSSSASYSARGRDGRLLPSPEEPGALRLAGAVLRVLLGPSPARVGHRRVSPVGHRRVSPWAPPGQPGWAPPGQPWAPPGQPGWAPPNGQSGWPQPQGAPGGWPPPPPPSDWQPSPAAQPLPAVPSPAETQQVPAPAEDELDQATAEPNGWPQPSSKPPPRPADD